MPADLGLCFPDSLVYLLPKAPRRSAGESRSDCLRDPPKHFPPQKIWKGRQRVREGVGRGKWGLHRSPSAWGAQRTWDVVVTGSCQWGPSSCTIHSVPSLSFIPTSSSVPYPHLSSPIHFPHFPLALFSIPLLPSLLFLILLGLLMDLYIFSFFFIFLNY